MILRTIHTGGWLVDVFFCITRYDETVLEAALKDIDAPIGKIVRMRQIARDDEYNTGFTWANNSLKKAVEVIGKATRQSELMNSFCHEMWHLTAYIAYFSGMDSLGEEPAYLMGDTSMLMTDIVGMFICPHCACERNGKKMGRIWEKNRQK